MGEPRDIEAVEQELAAINVELVSEADAGYIERLRGSKSALLWAIGRTSTAPASGRLTERPSAGDLYSEGMWADEIVTGVRPLPHDVSRAFAGGVAGALMWMLRRTSESPSPVDNPGLRPASEVLRALDANRQLLATPPPHWDQEDLEEQRGVVAALAWIAGQGAPSPVTGLKQAAGVVEVNGELERAKAMTRIGAVPGAGSRDFAGGVYDALLWTLERSDRQPGPL